MSEQLPIEEPLMGHRISWFDSRPQSKVGGGTVFVRPEVASNEEQTNEEPQSAPFAGHAAISTQLEVDFVADDSSEEPA